MDKIRNYYVMVYKRKHFPFLHQLLFTKNKIIAYKGFLGDGNFGDELVYEATKKVFHKSILLPVQRFTPFSLKLYKRFFKSRVSGIVIGGGTLISPHKIDQFDDLLRIKERSKSVFLHGTGLKYEGKGEEWSQILGSLENIYGGVRGPLSQDNLRRNYEIEIPVIGDAAFALYKKETYMQHSSRALKIILNYGTHTYHPASKMSRAVINEFIKNKITSGYEVLFLPFHSRDESIARKLILDNPAVKLLPIPRNYQAASEVFREAEFAIGERLHFNIMALMNKCPFLSVNYASKHEDFLLSMDLKEAGFKMEEITLQRITENFEGKENIFQWEKIGNMLEYYKKNQIEEGQRFLQSLS